MLENLFKAGITIVALPLLIQLSAGVANADTLNAEAINPHAEAPRKRISVAQKMAAADARKKRRAEIAAGRAGRPARSQSTNQQPSPAGSAGDAINGNK